MSIMTLYSVTKECATLGCKCGDGDEEEGNYYTFG